MTRREQLVAALLGTDRNVASPISAMTIENQLPGAIDVEHAMGGKRGGAPCRPGRPARPAERPERAARRSTGHVDADDVAGASTRTLLGDDTRNITGTTLCVDSSYDAMGM